MEILSKKKHQACRILLIFVQNVFTLIKLDNNMQETEPELNLPEKKKEKTHLGKD